MNTAWRKVVRDLWNNKGRSLLVVTSIAAGVMAVGMILASNTLMGQQMTRSQLASHASSIWLFLDGLVDEATLNGIERLPGVEYVEGRIGGGIRWKTSLEADWQDANLFAIGDYERQQLDLLQLRTGTWPQTDTLDLEWTQQAPYGLPAVGGTLYLEVGERPRRYAVTGVLRDPSQAAPPFSTQPTFYVTRDTIEGLVGYRDFSELRVSVDHYSETEAERVAGLVEDRLEKAGVGVGFRWLQAPNRHWAQDIMDGIGLILAVMAAASLGLSAILVINTINAIIAQQVPQIGIMKTVGGVRRQISQLYLAGVAVYGLISLLVSVPLGAAAANAYARWILSILNVPVPAVQLVPATLLVQIGAGMVVPLLAALWPVLRGVAVSVREALSPFGLGSGGYGAGRIDRLLARVRFLPPMAILSLRNTFRRMGRMALTEGVLITAGAIFMMVVTTHYSFTQAIKDIWGGLGFDAFLIFDTPQRIEEVEPIIAAHPNVDRVEMWIWRSATADSSTGEQFQVTLQGVPRDGQMYSPTLTEGRNLQPQDGHALLLNQKLARDLGLTVGDEIELDLGEDGTSTWTIVGLIFDLINNQSTAYVHTDTLNLEMHQVGRASLARIRGVDGSPAAQTALVEDLRQRFEDLGVGLAVAQTSFEDQEAAEAQFSILTTILMTMTVVMAAVGSIGLSGTLSINVIERRREIGVMRAVGASSRDVGLVFMGEGLLLGVVSWAQAVPLSMLAGRPFVLAIGDIIQFPGRYQLAVSGFWVWLGIVLVLSLAASWLPARRATRISVNASLAYE
jgi:putative ABC transport system permease protein